MPIQVQPQCCCPVPLMPPAEDCADCCVVTYTLSCSGVTNKSPGGCDQGASCSIYNGMFEMELQDCDGPSNFCFWLYDLGCDTCVRPFSTQAHRFGLWGLAIGKSGNQLVYNATPSFFTDSWFGGGEEFCVDDFPQTSSFLDFPPTGVAYYELVTEEDDLQCDLPRTLYWNQGNGPVDTIYCDFPETIQIIPMV